jgi:hypothetical protein
MTAAGMIAAMLEEPEGPRNADGHGPLRRWRWAAPIGAAVLVVGVVVGMVVAQPSEDDLPAAGDGVPKHEWKPRFLVTAGRIGDVSGTAESPWFQVHDIADGGRPRLVVSVPPPSPSGGEVRSVVAGPGRTFVVAAWRAKPCETVLYRFKLTDDGHPEDITPITGGTIPALVAGLAISPDSRRIAYATAPCGDAPERSLPDTTPITLAVLDSTGQSRTWTSSRPAIIGNIVWADDSRTLGYTTGKVTSSAPPTDPPPTNSRDVPRGVGAVQVRALHTEAPGSDLFASRVLFDQPDEDGTVNTAVMARDGRTGIGMMQKGEPPSTIVFTFSEGQPMRVTSTIPAAPKGTIGAVSLGGHDDPRYACLDGVDAFGRVSGGKLRSGSRSTQRCSSAYETPE